jgi:DNA polymerase
LAKDNAAALKAIEKEVENLRASPLYEYRRENNYKVVFGKGNPEARVMFIGEAPGKQEAISGQPFVGAAGRVLDELLKSIGLERPDVYITNILKDRPPENRDPRKEEIAIYVPFLRRQLEILQPQVIVTLGRFAMEFIFEEFKMPEQGGSISVLHGKALHASAPYGPIRVLPLFHPAVTFYRREQREVLKKDFQALREALEVEG